MSLYYEVNGSGQPLLLISGLGVDNSCWSGLVKKFAKQFKTIVFDNPGSGRSGQFKKPHTIRQLAVEVIRLLDHLGIERAHIIGHSMGGYIAQELAINYPNRVNKLILEATTPICSGLNKTLFVDLASMLEKETIEEWIKVWTFWLFSPRTFASGSFVETFIEQAVKYPYPASVAGFKAQVEAISKFDSRKRLSCIKAKTLIIHGEDDVLFLPDEAGVLAKRIPNSKFKLIKNTAHYVHLEDPVSFIKIVMGFLGKS